MTQNDFFLFISIFDKDWGWEVQEAYPAESNDVDYEQISIQIFTAFRSLIFDENNTIKEETLLNIPYKSLNKKVKIFVDILQNQDSINYEQPFMVILLIPEYFSEEKSKRFDQLIKDLGLNYKKSENANLNEYLDKFKSIFLKIERQLNATIEIDENYTFPIALMDFKKSLEMFSKGEYDNAYFLLKKAHLRFKKENNLKAIIESTYFLGMILSQLGKNDDAFVCFQELESLAKELHNKKYLETAIFMAGVSAYKEQDFKKSLGKLMQLEKMEQNFINVANYYLIYSQVLRFLGLQERAIDILQNILNNSTIIDNSKEKARLLFEFGNLSYQMSVKLVKKGKRNQSILASYFQNALKAYKNAIEIWEEQNNFKDLITAYKIVGNIFELLHEIKLSNDAYYKALEKAEISNDIINRIEIFKYIVQNMEKLQDDERLVRELDEMLSNIRTFAYTDLHTISIFHRYLGEALFRLGKDKDALSEFIIALNIQRKIKPPLSESLIVLDDIIEIYKKENNEEYIEYYKEEYIKIQEEIHQNANIDSLNSKLGIFKEFWIFHTNQILLYSYAPNTEVDPNLFSGFLIAMQDFGRELTSNTLKSLKTGSDYYILYREENLPFFVVGRTKEKINLDREKNTLKFIYDTFKKKFKDSITKFDGNTERYSDFLEILKQTD